MHFFLCSIAWQTLRPQDMQVFKYHLRKLHLNRSPPKSKQIPGNVETDYLDGAKISHQNFYKLQEHNYTQIQVDIAICLFPRELTDSLWGQG